MRQSRQTSFSTNNDRYRYAKCQRKKQHNKQSLNFICLTPTCKFKGLICPQCKTSQHANHIIQPVKTFLLKIDQNIKKIQQQKGPSKSKGDKKLNQIQILQKLQSEYSKILGILQLQVQMISEKIRHCEQTIMKDYVRSRQKIQQEFQKQNIFFKKYNQIQNYFMNSSQVHEGYDIKQEILSFMSLSNLQKSQIKITNEAQGELNNYIFQKNTIQTNLILWQKQTENILEDLYKSKPQYETKLNKVRPTTAIQPINKKPTSFSPQFKTQSVVLQKQNKIAKVKDDKNGKIILFNGNLQQKGFSCKLKILNIGMNSVIGIGLCLKNIVANVNYKFQKNKTNSNGTFILTSQGRVYSDNEITMLKNGFTFKTNDEISIDFDPKQEKIIFKKKTDNKNYQLSLKHVTQQQFKQLYFCVSLGNVNDKVQIIS